jgi:hypothetical protein
VPEGHGFVDRAPADIFFMRYEDIYNLLHSNRLDYNLVRLYSLHMALKVKREKTKGIMIVDPYYMCDVALAYEGDRAMVKEYLGNIFVENLTALLSRVSEHRHENFFLRFSQLVRLQ